VAALAAVALSEPILLLLYAFPGLLEHKAAKPHSTSKMGALVTKAAKAASAKSAT
jgi:hypothetical protein